MNMLELFRPGFVWHSDVVRNGRVIQPDTVHNLMPDEMAIHMNGVVFSGATQVPTWHIAPFEGNYVPQSVATAATIAAAATECTAYDEPTRVEWIEAASGLALTNSASRAIFTMNAAKLIYGGFLISSPSKAGVTGVMASLVRFGSPKDLQPGDLLRITAGMAFSN